jgi:sodium/bile acid cotransporter 7
LTLVITVPKAQDDERYTNGDDSVAPIATASSTLRIKVWNLYITLLSTIVDLGPEEGRQAFGQKEWKALVNKVREGEIWEEIVRTGYRGLEGSVDADVVYNL